MAINTASLAAAQETERQLAMITSASEELRMARTLATETTAAVSRIPEPVKDVKFYGAVGDGVHDDTDAFNRAAATGSLIVGPGTYLLDPVKRVTVAVNGTKVRFDHGPGEVRCLAKQNSAARYRMFNVNASDCDIDLGGSVLLGDRYVHLWTRQANPAEDTHEWGYVFFLGGSRNRLYGTALLTGATGDGLGITGPDHEVFGLTMKDNRRQGCSAFNASRLNFHHNNLSNTGNQGKPDPAPKALIGPFCGFDIEPDRNDCLDVKIAHNTFGPNNRSGAICWVNSRAGVVRLSGEFYENEFIGNSNGSWLNDEVPGRMNIEFSFLRNRFVNNKNHDIRCDQGTTVRIGSTVPEGANVFDDFNERTDRFRSGVVSPEIGVYRGAKVIAGINSYV